MKNTKNLWFTWTIASSLPIIFVFPPSFLGIMVAEIPPDNQLFVVSLTCLFLGAALGFSQSIVLRHHGYSMERWTLLSAIGLAIGGFTIFFPLERSIMNSGYVAPIVIGLALGVAQTVAFPHRSSIHLLWVPVSIVGATAAYFAGILLDPFGYTVPFGVDVIGAVAIYIFIYAWAVMITMTIYGVITGLAIQRLTEHGHDREPLGKKE